MNAAYSIEWSPVAEGSYLETISYILSEWSITEAEKFIQKVEYLLNSLKINQNLCPKSQKLKNLRRCVITSQTSLVYRINESTIELVAFFDNRSQHPY